MILLTCALLQAVAPQVQLTLNITQDTILNYQEQNVIIKEFSAADTVATMLNTNELQLTLKAIEDEKIKTIAKFISDQTNSTSDSFLVTTPTSRKNQTNKFNLNRHAENDSETTVDASSFNLNNALPSQAQFGYLGLVYPKNPVSIGDKWTAESKTNSGTKTHTYQLTEYIENSTAKILLTTNTTSKQELTSPGGPLTITKELKETHTYTINPQTGIIQSIDGTTVLRVKETASHYTERIINKTRLMP